MLDFRISIYRYIHIHFLFPWSGTGKSWERGGSRGASSAGRHVAPHDQVDMAMVFLFLILVDTGYIWLYFVILVINGDKWSSAVNDSQCLDGFTILWHHYFPEWNITWLTHMRITRFKGSLCKLHEHGVYPQRVVLRSKMPMNQSIQVFFPKLSDTSM